MTSVRFRMTSRKRHSVILLIVGLIWGHLTFLFITSLLPRGQRFPCTLPSLTQMGEGITSLEITRNSLPVSPRQLLFVGVMTSRKLLRTRALAIFKTWGAALNGSLVFFVGRENDDIVTKKSHDVVGRGGDVVRKGDDVVTRVGDVVIRDDVLGRGDDAVTKGDDVVGGGDGMLRGDVTGREDDVVEEDTLPVHILENVEDSEYPPQKKSFAMLEFMHREYGGRYHWFMRADDDLFVDVRRMRMLLSSLNSSLPLYVGHPGTGRPEEAGRLGLPEGVPYCMGGTGVVLSSDLLTSLADSLVTCAQNTVTYHEDSELGRCIYNVSSLACLQSKKINRRFKQSYDDTSGQWIRKAMQSSQPYVTFHPVKDTRYVYDSAALVSIQRITELQDKVRQLTSTISCMDTRLNRKASTMATCGNSSCSQNERDVCESDTQRPKGGISNRFTDISWFLIHQNVFYTLWKHDMKLPVSYGGVWLGLTKILRHLTAYVKATDGRKTKRVALGSFYRRVIPKVGVEYVAFVRDTSSKMRPYVIRQSFDELLFVQKR